MKQFVEKMDQTQVAAAYPLADLVPGWYFRVREVSAGQFVAQGTDLFGRTVSEQGNDPRQVLRACTKWAQKLVSSGGTSSAA
jgi:hypothetical protein